MKNLKITLSTLLILSGITLWSQVAINLDESNPDPSAMLDVKSTTKGFLMPRMTTAQRLAISSPAIGLSVYDIDLDSYSSYNGSQWTMLGSGFDTDWTVDGINMYSGVSGKVGIGSSNPSKKLDVDLGDILVQGTGSFDSITEQATLYLGTVHNYIKSEYGYGLKIGTYAVGDVLGIKEISGNVGIGTTDPDYTLDVVGSVNINKDIVSGTALRVNGHSAIEYSSGTFLWGGASENYFHNWVGIGAGSPLARLHISGPATSLRGQVSITDDNADDPFISFYEGETFKSYVGTINGKAQWGSMDGSDMVIGGYGDGNVGVGTFDPNVKFHVDGGSDINLYSGGYLVVGDVNNTNIGIDDNEIMARDCTVESDLFINREGGNIILNELHGNVGIGKYPSVELDVEGTAKCNILQITGGADIAEPFDIIDHEIAQPGMVLVIDPENPGKLKISDKEYNRCVAGIISGAGEINPGMIMGQTGSVADGDYPVALSGRVYCYAETSNGSIQPGDLITTSDTPGYAMKATDFNKAQGAIIGKAMTSLDSGKDLILVLVTLQ